MIENADGRPSGLSIGRGLFDNGAFAASLSFLSAALAECRADGRDDVSAECLRWIGAAHAQLGAVEEAVRAFLDALALLPDPRSEVAIECAESAGIGLLELDRPREALPHLRAASIEYHRVGAGEAAADCDDALGWAFVGVENFTEATQAFRRAADGMIAAGRHDDAAVCLRWLAAAHANLDAVEESVNAFIEAVPLFADPLSELAILCAECAGLGLNKLDRPREAIPYLRTASTRYRQAGIVADAAETDDSLASALVDIEESAEAITAYRRASDAYLSLGRVQDAADSRALAGTAAVELEDAALVRGEFSAARVLFERLDDAVDDVAQCSFMLGLAAVDLNENANAEVEMRRARAGFDACGGRSAVAECDERLGGLLADDGRLDDALSAFTAAIAGYTEFERHGDIADCHRGIANVHDKSGRMDLVVEALGDAVTHDTAAGRHDLAADMDTLRGMSLFELNRRDEAIAALAAAREYYRRNDRQSDVTWCDVVEAAGRMSLGEDIVEDTFARASAEFHAVGTLDRYAWTELKWATAAVNREDVTAALMHLRAARAGAESAGDGDLARDCDMGEAAALMAIGGYDRAIVLAMAARASFLRRGYGAKAANCLHIIGIVKYFQGRIAEAEVALKQARVESDHLGAAYEVAMIDFHLGQVIGESGRLDLGDEVIGAARAGFARLGLPEMVAATAGISAAMLFRRKDYAGAEAALRAAEVGLPRITDFAVDLALLRQNLASAILLQGGADRALPMMRRARDAIASGSIQRDFVAMCDMNIAVAELMRHRLDSAYASLRSARSGYSTMGATFFVAKADFIDAAIAIARSQHQIALDIAIPAAIFIDAQRFTFAQAASRIAWSELNAEFRVTLFDWVHKFGDKTMLADLVETSINSGTHFAGVGPADPTVSMGALVGVGTATTDAASPNTRSAAAPYDLGGAAALLAGPVLPLRPPPLLIMHKGHTALGAYAERADELYERIIRPSAIDALR
ncbi:hypothetical protein [Antrihabitans spumae]|uniref:Gamma-soluble NSF attachment protein n=1 Tax=Antrihabitans spumae TaxID=3373370 RepID=A0ABW7KFQ4_9NOCA